MAASEELSIRLEQLTGRRPVTFTRAEGGYTPAGRWIITFADGGSAFAKVGTTGLTADWLRLEHDFYGAMGDRPWLARMIGWSDGDQPLLVLEDLSGAQWPPPWSRATVAQALSTLDAIATTEAPAFIPSLAELERTEARLGRSWSTVARDPGPFLSLGLCSPEWLEEALQALRASEQVSLEGDALLHLDFRSDNVCFAGERTVVVDWNLACTGNPLVDVAFWLPGLEAEGGPPPEAVAPAATPYAGIVAGFFAARAGLPDIPDAPFVRRVQREQLATALPWAVRALRLPVPNGAH